MARPSSAPDPDLQALPEPRRPWRNATLVSLALTLVASLTLLASLIPEANYALVSGQPTELADLGGFRPDARHANTWVHGKGALSNVQSGYRRPLDPDRFRLAQVAGNSELWIEMREPSGSLGEHFVPPESFVGRLVPFSSPGLRYRGLAAALDDSGQPAPSSDGWLLIDGETPSSTLWVFGVLALLASFAAFSAWGMVILLRPARS